MVIQMVNISSNINKTDNHLSPQLIEHKKYNDKRRSKSMFCFGTGTKKVMGVKPVNMFINSGIVLLVNECLHTHLKVREVKVFKF
jgi:AAA15 family ATPase/GTPase